MTAAASTERDTGITYRSVLVLAALVLLPGLAYLAGVLLPYYASDLDTLTTAELAAGEEPATGPEPVAAGWLGLLGSYSLVLAPLGALISLVGCAVQLLAGFRRSERRVTPAVGTGLVLVAGICLVAVAWFLSPRGRALTIWFTD